MTDYRLVPVEPTDEMATAAMNAETHANSVYGEPAAFSDIWRAMLSAAPAVQGGPVAFDEDAALSLAERTFSSEVDEQLAEDVIQYARRLHELYAAPQPAGQQPPADGSLTPVPDELFAAEFIAWWEQHGQFCRSGGGDYERTFAFEAWRHLYPRLMSLQKLAAEQQPALTKYQPCGCVLCTCEHETQCQGCGAKHCGTHPVGQFSGPVYQQPSPDVTALAEALERSVAGFDALSGMVSLDAGARNYARLKALELNAVIAAHRKQGGEA